MIGIEALGVYVPSARIHNKSRMAQFDVDEEFLTVKTGMLSLAVKGENEETSDLCCKAYENLQSRAAVSTSDIECIVVVTQNPDERGLPHTSAIVHGKLGLPSSCAAYDISLGCSGYVYGLSVIQGFMAANGFRQGILFTADPYSKVLDVNDKTTSLLFGDAATATLIGNDPVWKTGRFVFGSQGIDGDAIRVSAATGKLEMNGRAVFSFAATVVPKSIKEALALNDLTTDKVDRFVLHQGSRFIVDTLQKRLGVAAEKVIFDAAEYGNTVSSSIPILLDKLWSRDKLVVIAGFGVGLSWASTVLYRVKE